MVRIHFTPAESHVATVRDAGKVVPSADRTQRSHRTGGLCQNPVDAKEGGWRRVPREPPDIRAYAALHEQFPHERTADQWFSESLMESYRGLGSLIIGKLCGSLETARTAPGGRLDIEALAHSVTCYLESTRAQPPVVSDATDPRLTGVPGPGEGAHPPA